MVGRLVSFWVSFLAGAMLASGSVMFVADNIFDSLLHGMIHYDEITSTGVICCTFSWKLKDF